MGRWHDSKLEKRDSVWQLELVTKFGFDFVVHKECFYGVRIEDTNDVVKFVNGVYGMEPEEVVRIFCWSEKHNLIGFFEVSRGSFTSAYVAAKEVLHRCICCKAVYYTVIHNHVGASLTPSKEDYDLTSALMSVEEVLQIWLKEHVVYNEMGWKRINKGVFL